VSVALVFQHARRIRRIMLSSGACLDLPYLATSQKEHDFGRKVLNIKCVVFSPYNVFSETFQIVRRIKRAVIM